MNEIFHHVTLLTLAVLLHSCSPSNRVVPDGSLTSASHAEARICPVHHTQMTHKVAIEDEAGFYNSKFLGDHWKHFPHDGYLYNVCRIEPATMVWVCSDCQRYSRNARRVGRIH